MKLYIFQVAPNPTKVRLYLAEKAASGTVIDIPQVSINLPKGEHRKPEHLARNPLGRLPVLELNDGSCLTESLAIIEYLEECYPHPPLIGRSPRVLDARLLDGRPFVTGDRPSIADCTLEAALQFARFGQVEIDPSFQHLLQWDARYRERPAAKSVLTL